MHYTSIRQRSRRISPSLSLIFIINFYFSCSPLLLYAAMDTITRDQSISHGKTIFSAGEKFELGFFNPNDQDSNNTQYLGIWYYNLVPKTVVWVANRDSPITNSTPIFTIGDDGNLMVLDASGNIYWSTGASLDSNNTSAKLMDSGNLILSEGNSSKIIWQSFDYPYDTFLSGMKLDKNRRLTSWKTEKDPSLGTFTFGIDKDGADEFIIWNKKAMYWKSRFSTGIDELGYMPGAVSDLLTKFSLTGKNSTYVNISISKPSEDERLLMLPSGQIKYFIWKKNVSKWDSPWWEPSNQCSVYHACGPNSKCNKNTTPVCNCLPGYDSSSPEDWNSSEFSGGCRRKMEGCKKDDTFLKLNIVKVADTNRSTIALVEYGKEEDCKTSCLNDCNCMAYMYKAQDTWRRGINLRPNCWIWSEDLMDAQEEHHGGQDFWLRQPAVKSANQSLGVESGGTIPSEPPCNFSKDCQSWPHSTCKADKMRCICNENFLWNPSVGCVEGNSSSRRSSRRSLFGIVFPLTSITVIIFLGIIGYWWRKKSLKRKDAQTAKVILGADKFTKNERKDLDIPFFDFQSIAVATNNFSDSNKLGQGGFGPVYKGNLPGGQEIAVKRLSRCSGQGLEEFKTEVILIAKLQHRNLVRLLGYCVQGDEQMLLYEYMPNKILDYYLFDQNRHTLDWEKRLSIISGIARGLLYLHQDSRLRIIHRDLKPSNILLDELWNPKISDFGMARIFGENQTQANTNRVIGTYGYMPPEYALEGTYSEKSDVFSFGVMLLEIISGKKNTTFYHSEHSFSLLGNTWRLWREGRGLELMDPLLNEGSNIQDVLKYIHVGLLCVQEDAADRPTMASVVAMFVGESNNLATPNKPAFFTTKSLSAVESSSHGSEICSKNDITISTLQGR